MLLTAWAAAIGQPAHVTSTVEEITGAPAKTFLDWATDHAAEFVRDRAHTRITTFMAMILYSVQPAR
jgi:hypothetical protein